MVDLISIPRATSFTEVAVIINVAQAPEAVDVVKTGAIVLTGIARAFVNICNDIMQHQRVKPTRDLN